MEAKHVQVIAKFQEDLREGLSLLYEFYGQSLLQYSLKNWDLDEDECYDVLYKTLEIVGKVIDRNEFTSERHFQNWIFKIHRNNTLMTIRSKRAKEEVRFQLVDWQQEYADAAEEGDEINFEGNIIHLENGKLYDDNNVNSPIFSALEKALQMINETDKDILLLRMNNYSYQEIATMLGLEDKQLKVRFLRAKAKVEKRTMDILKENMQ